VNERDPRTWDWEFTKKWLEEKQGKYLKKVKELGRRVEEKHKALSLGKVVAAKPKVNPDAKDKDKDTIPMLLIDTIKFLPEGYTGKHLARYYMADWINDWVKASLKSPPAGSGIGQSKWADTVKDAGLEIYGEFTYILLTARTKSRNEILKSRKKIENLYGMCNPLIVLLDMLTQRVGDKPVGPNWEDNDAWTITEKQWEIFDKHKGMEYEEALEKSLEDLKAQYGDNVDGERVEQVKSVLRKGMWEDWVGLVRTSA
jgi:kinesin family protein 2/24